MSNKYIHSHSLIWTVLISCFGLIVLLLLFLCMKGHINYAESSISSDALIGIIATFIGVCTALMLGAECAGIAFAEASAYGLPIFTYNTGGISNYVIDGVNGYALPVNSTELDFYRKIEYCLKTGILKELSVKGPSLYRNRLNWNHWGGEVYHLIRSLLKQN